MSAYFINSLFKNYVISLIFFIIYHTNSLHLIFPSAGLIEKENGKQVQLFSKENEIMNRKTKLEAISFAFISFIQDCSFIFFSSSSLCIFSFICMCVCTRISLPVKLTQLLDFFIHNHIPKYHVCSSGISNAHGSNRPVPVSDSHTPGRGTGSAAATSPSPLDFF